MAIPASRPLHMDPRVLWPDYAPTPLIELPALARVAGVARILVKDESRRPLGSFKALGGTLASLRALARAVDVPSLQALLAGRGARAMPRLVCASDGNHGLAVASAAQRAGTRASVYLPAHAGDERAARIVASGGDVVRIAGTYDDAVVAAAEHAARGGGLLVADTSEDPDDLVVRDVMAGYGLLVREVRAQLRARSDPPSHACVQAGVGGLAAAMAHGLRRHMCAPGRTLVVEPERAACVGPALARGEPVRIDSDLATRAEMLACGRASAPALRVLRRHAVGCVTVDEDELQGAVAALRDAGGPDTTPSGAAGLAGLLHVARDPQARDVHALDANSIVLLVATEGAC